MTVLMTANQNHPLGGTKCRIEWQGLSPDDQVSAHLTAPGVKQIFPDQAVTGIRPQPFVPNAWLLDVAALPTGWEKLDLVVVTPSAHTVSLAVEVRPEQPGAAPVSLQHSGLTTVGGAPMLALRLTPGNSGPVAVPYETAFVDVNGPVVDGIDVPETLREAAVLALHENVVRSGEPVTAVVDLSASMRPRLASGAVASVLTALQAVAGAADQRAVSVVAVSDQVHEARALELSDDPEEFLRQWTREIGLRTGVRGPLRQWVTDHPGNGLIVTVSDQPRWTSPTGARHCQVRLIPPGDGTPVREDAGTVVIADGRPDAMRVVRALAHASPAA
jgi:hypothetical protein